MRVATFRGREWTQNTMWTRLLQRTAVVGADGAATLTLQDMLRLRTAQHDLSLIAQWGSLLNCSCDGVT